MHLDHPAFKDDQEDVVARAVEDGVSGFMNIGFDPGSARATAELLDKYPFFYGVVGTHPHDAKGHDKEFENQIEKLLERPQVLGIGEVGLDYYYDYSPRGVQKSVFGKMVRLARHKNKPLVIHCRDAGAEVLDVLTEEAKEHRGIFHAFSGDREMARKVLDLGFYLGIGGVVTFKNSRLLEAVRGVPLERLVLETDCPYLTPHPFRGRRNEPGLVRYVAETLAAVYKTSPGDVVRRTTDNFYAAMGVDAIPPPLIGSIGEAIYIHTVPDADPARQAAAAEEIAGSMDNVKEAVFCGYDDPLGQLDQVTSVAARLKRCGIPSRLIAGIRGYVASGAETVETISGKVGKITVRMYGNNAAQHEKLANTGRGDAAFESLLDFVARSVGAGIPTDCQFVAAPKTKSEICRALADSLGAGFLISKFRSL